MNPAVVAIGGGHGLAATLRAARRYAGDLTAIVSVADDGGSTGRLRDAREQPAPGDLRKSIVALADAESSLAPALGHRFADGELAGHAFGNLMIAAMAESTGGLVAALDEIGKLTGSVGRVLPATLAPVHLRARCGDTVVEGQVEIAATSGISTVAVDPADAEATPEALDAIAAADQILLGPGSLFTSVLAAAVVPGITEALAGATAPLVYVCNLHPQHRETDGYGVAEHLDALGRHGIEPDVVVYDATTMSSDGIERAGLQVVAAELAATSGLAHDPARLARVLGGLAQQGRGLLA